MKSASLLRSQSSLASLILQLKNSIFAVSSSELSHGYLQSQCELLQSYFTNFRENHLKLTTKDTLLDDAYFKDNKFTVTETIFTQTVSYIYNEMARIRRMETIAAHQVNTVRPINQSHLPKINLPLFSGLRDDWEAFRDIFVSMVHNDVSLTPVQKLYYLKGLVQGQAKTALEAVSVTDANYVLAWNLLLNRYDNKRLLVRDHLLALTSLTVLKYESADGLQRLLDDLVRRKESLCSIGRPVEHWDDWFLFFAVRSMDEVTRRDWENQLKDDDSLPAFEDIQSFLKQRIQTLKATETLRTSKRTHQDTSASVNTPSSSHRPLKLLTTSTKYPCPICQARHYVGYCPNWESVDASSRRRTAAQLRLCFNCLQLNHVSSNCPSKSRCRVCKAAHHTTLHDAAPRQKATIEDRNDPSPKRFCSDPTSDSSEIQIGSSPSS